MFLTHQIKCGKTTKPDGKGPWKPNEINKEYIRKVQTR